MTSIITALLFSIAANLDNIIIGITYGIEKINIPLHKNILISSVTSLFTFLAMCLGNHLANIIPQNTEKLIGALTLIVIGIYTIINQLISKRKENKIQKNYIMLTIMLSLNNIAAGIAASISGINIIVATLCTLILSTIFLHIGNLIGKKSLNNQFIERYSSVISALLLIIAGTLQL